jgi:hypothetical protein
VDVQVIEVRPPSVLAETGYVMRAVFHLAYWTAIVIALVHAPGRGSGGAVAGVPYDEVAFSSLAPAEQRTYRLLREGLAKAERVRIRSGRWPTIDDLVGLGVPPFVDPVDRAGYTWTRTQTGAAINYVGAPTTASGLATLAAVILEPEPGTPVDPTAVHDDIHHILPDGSLVHVTVWRAPGLRSTVAAMAAPRVEDGWRRVVSATE